MSARPGTVLRDATFGVAFIILFFAGIEGLARLLAPFPPSSKPTYQAFDDVLYFHKPNSKGYEISPVGEFDPVLLRYNSGGFRGDWSAVPPGRELVAVLGDSFVEARQVREEQTSVGLLGARFPDRFFINGGCSGFTTTTEYLLLKDRILALHPKRVVLFFTFNDYLDNYQYQGGYYTQPDLWERGPDPRFKPAEYTSRTLSPTDWLESHSATYSGLKHLLGPKAKLGAPAAAKTHPRLTDSFRAVNRPDVELDEIERRIVKFTHDGLERMAELARKNQIDFKVFIIPLPTQLNAREWRAGKVQYYGYGAEEIDTGSEYQARLLRFCRERRISCFDLLPLFKKTAPEGATYLDFDGHWSALGNRVAADAVAQALGEKP